MTNKLKGISSLLSPSQEMMNFISVRSQKYISSTEVNVYKLKINSTSMCIQL